MQNELKVFSGNSNPALSEKICEYLGISLGEATVTRFSDGECRIKIQENVRGTDCFVIQSTSPPVNHNLMELLIMIDALKRASAARITAVIPYFGYSRQDRKDSPRVPITAKLVANILETAGADRVLVMDIHARQIQGFFDCPVDNILPTPIWIDYIHDNIKGEITVVAPDPGGVERVRDLAKKLKANIAVIDKRRPEPNVARVYYVVGDVKGKDAFILDDMADTAGTLVAVAEALKEKGAKKVYAAVTHGVLSGDAIKKIRESDLVELLMTDTIMLPDEKKIPIIKKLTVAPLLGEAIKRIHEETSVSVLFI
ncbi:MAG: ribose-phosphate pyrophosphokinase [Elusimicrobia bacterium]|nr:ribose-phosphate pyrophosphokinase [Elusimicrobiota bacterium]